MQFLDKLRILPDTNGLVEGNRMAHLMFAFFTLVLALSLLHGDEVIAFAPDREILESSFRVESFSEKPRAVLVLCAGQNGDGREFVANAQWRDFCRRSGLALVVPHFVSADADLLAGRGYFRAERGSGACLLRAVEQAGWGELPLLVYGFSGGAHFAMSFAAFAPERVAAFCAYSFAWWSEPPRELNCPALIACGQFDGRRYGASFAYFQDGRRDGKPWAWVSVEGIDHAPSPELEAFVRGFFEAALRARSSDRVAVDNIRETVLEERASEGLTTSILPSEKIFASWREVHHP